MARGVIHQMFPLHEQRILNQLMTSWVQAVCERQPLGKKHVTAGLPDAVFLSRLNTAALTHSADDICDYFGVKISMYFAWLGFYTNSMLYPAVIGFLLWILAESDQVLGLESNSPALLRWSNKKQKKTFSLNHDHACVSLPDQSGHLLRGFRPLQCRVGDTVLGALEEAGGGAGLPMGHPGHPRRVLGGAQASVQGEEEEEEARHGWKRHLMGHSRIGRHVLPQL